MNEELKRLKSSIKNKRKVNISADSVPKTKLFSISKVISRFFITVIVTLIALIGLKTHHGFKEGFYKEVFQTNLSFAPINDWYQKTFGNPMPFKNLFIPELKSVFEEKLSYSNKENYLDGVKLTVSDQYLIPSMEPGIVIFEGEKEGYGKTIIIQQTTGVDVWYSGISNVSVGLYDYIEKGKLIGEATERTFYLVFEKNGEFLNYNEYLP